VGGFTIRLSEFTYLTSFHASHSPTHYLFFGLQVKSPAVADEPSPKAAAESVEDETADALFQMDDCTLRLGF
jgi:hypothetical protein